MGANIGQTYEQIKALDGFPYNAVGGNWTVNNIQGKYIILKHDNVGLGVSEQELEEHFKLLSSYSDYDENDYDGDGVEEDEDDNEIDDDCCHDDSEDDSDNKQVGKFNSFLRRLGFKK